MTYPDSLEVIWVGKVVKVVLVEKRRRGDATRGWQDGDVVVLLDTAAVLLTHFRQRGPSAVALTRDEIKHSHTYTSEDESVQLASCVDYVGHVPATLCVSLPYYSKITAFKANKNYLAYIRLSDNKITRVCLGLADRCWTISPAANDDWSGRADPSDGSGETCLPAVTGAGPGEGAGISRFKTKSPHVEGYFCWYYSVCSAVSEVISRIFWLLAW